MNRFIVKPNMSVKQIIDKNDVYQQRRKLSLAELFTDCRYCNGGGYIPHVNPNIYENDKCSKCNGSGKVRK